jgi:hypothetical protein
MKLTEALRQFQTRWVVYALIESHGNIRQAAKLLGKHPATMQRWVTLLKLTDFARTLRYSNYRCVAYRYSRLLAIMALFLTAHS